MVQTTEIKKGINRNTFCCTTLLIIYSQKLRHNVPIFVPGTDSISLLIFLILFFFLLVRPLQKSPRLRHFKWDQNETWQDCSLCINWRMFDIMIRWLPWRPPSAGCPATALASRPRVT